MAGRPGYRLVGDSAGHIAEFPRAERPGSLPIGTRRARILHETEGGVEWTYLQFERKIWELNFRVTEDMLLIHQTLDDLVHGDIDEFYFYPDIEDEATFYLVRCEDSDFQPKQLDERGVYQAQETAFYDVTLRMREAITSVSISV